MLVLSEVNKIAKPLDRWIRGKKKGNNLLIPKMKDVTWFEILQIFKGRIMNTMRKMMPINSKLRLGIYKLSLESANE